MYYSAEQVGLRASEGAPTRSGAQSLKAWECAQARVHSRMKCVGGHAGGAPNQKRRLSLQIGVGIHAGGSAPNSGASIDSQK